MQQNKSAFVKDPSRDFTRERILSFFHTMMMTISMECSTIQGELYRYFSFSTKTPTSSAFIQQRDKLKPEAFRSLFHSFSGQLPSTSQDGYHFFAVDGSTVLIPLENQKQNEAYSYFKRKEQRSYYQLHLNATYDLINHRYATAYIESRRGHNERGAFHQMLEYYPFPQNSVFIFDRGYEGYPLMAHILGKQQFFVSRVKDNQEGGLLKGIQLPQEEEFDFLFRKILVHRITKTCTEPTEAYHTVHHSNTPYFLNSDVKEFPMEFRIVRFRLDNGDYECLLTNLPEEKFSTEDLKQIYRMRWGIETSFRTLKHSIGLTSFHTKKVESIIQEIWARLLLYNFCSAVTAKIEMRNTRSQYKQKLNMANAIGICRRFLKEARRKIPPDVEWLISRALLPVRPERTVPRNKTVQSPKKFNYRPL